MLKYETDSRKVKKGQIFVALKGHTVDGHDYINDAIKNGAIKIVGEKNLNCPIEYEKVPSTEKYLKEHLKDDYADDINKLKIIGVTGTNGKTTTCYLLYQSLILLGEDVAYMGTIGFKYKDDDITLENTTPDILTIYNLLYDVYQKGCKYVVMEVSSHALSYERLYGLHIDYAAFTNLTEDHLDYHKTMENYLNEKLKIIDYLTPEKNLLVNIDDPVGIKFIEKNNGGLTLGLNGELKIDKWNFTPINTKLNFSYHNNSYEVTTNLTSKFNVYNYLTTVGILILMNYDIKDILKLAPKLKAPVGRCETHFVNNGYVVIDYAHTPETSSLCSLRNS